MTTYVLTTLFKPSPIPAPFSSPASIKKPEPVVQNATMAPIEISYDSSYLPFATALSHQVLIVYLSGVVLHTIYRSYAALPPSSATRSREPSRKNYVRVFSALAAVSLAFATYFGAKSVALSYRVWAAERGIELPGGLFGDKGALRPGYHPGRLQVVRWLSDTPFYRDTVEIIAETARYAWWGQQIDIASVSWSLYLALEGQRRNISNLWAFLALSQLVNLSFAQNLFFLAVLFTPVPLPSNAREFTRSTVPATSNFYSRTLEKFFPTKPEGFLPAPGYYLGLLFINLGAIFLIPLASNTPSFANTALISRLTPFSFLLLPYVIPNSWGKIHRNPHDAHKIYMTLFRTLSITSTLLHLNTSAVALFRNAPEKTYYRHSLLYPFKEEHRSALDRSSSAIGRVLGAISEHPVVSAVGIDVLLSGLTLGTWAGVRGLDAREMLASAVPWMKPVVKEVQAVTKEVKKEVEDVAEKVVDKTIEVLPTPAKRRVGRPKKSESNAGTSKDTAEPSTVRRGRSSKTPVPRTGDSSDEHEDPTYHPTPAAEVRQEGDEVEDEDWEAGALAWGLISAGGLGLGSAAVYGAEVMAR